jgi:hypothetical protein
MKTKEHYQWSMLCVVSPIHKHRDCVFSNFLYIWFGYFLFMVFFIFHVSTSFFYIYFRVHFYITSEYDWEIFIFISDLNQ